LQRTSFNIPREAKKKQEKYKELEEAIKKGSVVVPTFPFNQHTHGRTELCSNSVWLFFYTCNLSLYITSLLFHPVGSSGKERHEGEEE
jgi:hypothetical protein